MGSYYDDDPPRRHRSHHQSRRPVYEEEEVIESRSSRPQRQMDLVRRPRDDSTSSVEEIRRDFAPGEGANVYRRTTVRDKYGAPRARSVEHSYNDTRYADSRRSEGGRRSGRRDDRGSRRSRYDSDSESESPPRQRRKSFGEQALAALGIGGAAGAASSRGNRDRARSRSRRGDSRSRSRSRSGDGSKKIQQAVKAALAAGAVEAFRSRKEPGGFAVQGKRVLTAAIGAAGIDGAIDKDPNHHSTRHTIEAALGGLAGNRLINGARSRSRSRGRNGRKDDNGSGLGGLAAAGGLAALAGQALSSYRNKSKDRGRGYDSDDSRSPPRRRSNSVSAFITRGLDKGKAAIGMDTSEDKERQERRENDRSRRGYDDRVSRQSQGGYNDGYAPRPRGGGGEEKKEHDSSTDYSSEEEIKKQKKMHAKELITASLATVATIHAAHSIYQTREKREKRKEQFAEGKISKEEEQKFKRKGYLQDAASVGIAALGIKGAYSEWKEMKEQREEYHKTCEELDEKRQKRRAKQERQQRGEGGSYRSSEPDLNRRYVDSYGPRYNDGNPYSAGGLPPPPMGPPPMRY
ncbi:hypothetical protein MMC34_008447 [Xylographa carneopallida]|nr:hypothetical protein [Xylographa carneopallida]